VTRPRAADDFAIIRARMEELQREREGASSWVSARLIYRKPSRIFIGMLPLPDSHGTSRSAVRRPLQARSFRRPARAMSHERRSPSWTPPRHFPTDFA
jgi:hypothetical protein